MISTITLPQVYKQVSPTVRKNITISFIHRLRNYGDLESIIEEMPAIYDKKTLPQMYHEAISGPYPFLHINLTMKDKRKMFMHSFTKYLTPS